MVRYFILTVIFCGCISPTAPSAPFGRWTGKCLVDGIMDSTVTLTLNPDLSGTVNTLSFKGHYRDSMQNSVVGLYDSRDSFLFGFSEDATKGLKDTEAIQPFLNCKPNIWGTLIR